MKRGEVWWAELHPRSGSEQKGNRPAIIISHDGFNSIPGWHSIIIVPVSTSSHQLLRGPTSIPIPAGEGGIDRDSVALCHQVTTLDRAKLTKCLGLLSLPTLEKIEAGLKAAMDLL